MGVPKRKVHILRIIIYGDLHWARWPCLWEPPYNYKTATRTKVPVGRVSDSANTGRNDAWPHLFFIHEISVINSTGMF